MTAVDFQDVIEATSLFLYKLASLSPKYEPQFRIPQNIINLIQPQWILIFRTFKLRTLIFRVSLAQLPDRWFGNGTGLKELSHLRIRSSFQQLFHLRVSKRSVYTCETKLRVHNFNHLKQNNQHTWTYNSGYNQSGVATTGVLMRRVQNREQGWYWTLPASRVNNQCLSFISCLFDIHSAHWKEITKF